jgi:hypothetical protein
MSLSTLRSPSPERSPLPAYSISSDSTTFSFEDDPFAHSILEEVMEPAIKQEVLDGDGPARRVPDKYIESSDDEDNKAESMTTVFQDDSYCFNKLEDIESTLHRWARIEGFAMVRRDSKPKGNPTRVIIKCKRGGKYQSHGKDPSVAPDKQRKGSKSFKSNYPYRIVLKRGTIFDPWIISKQDHSTHNYGPDGVLAFHQYQMEEVLPEDIKDIITWYNNRIPVKSILSNLHAKFLERHEECHLNAKDISNIITANRNELLGELTPLQWLLKRLKEAGFNPKVDVNPQTKRLSRLFFAHPKALKLYRRNPDLLFINLTYKTNRWSMPLLNIGGATNNNMTIQVAVCFLSEESEPDYD